MQAKEWLDKQVGIHKLQKIYKYQSNVVFTHDPEPNDRVWIHGAEEIAKKMGIEIQKKEKTKNVYEVYFVYKGVEFWEAVRK